MALPHLSVAERAETAPAAPSSMIAGLCSAYEQNHLIMLMAHLDGQNAAIMTAADRRGGLPDGS